MLPLPKLIIIVPDDDIIKCVKDADSCQDVTKQFGRLINYVMTEHECAIATFKEFLPAKSLKLAYPQLLWIQAPMHDCFDNNNLWHKFNRALDKTAKCHSHVTTLALKKAWDPKDDELFLAGQNRYTTRGFNTYWEAVDRTVWYFDSIVLQKVDKRKTLKNSSNSALDQKDPFRWQNPHLNLQANTPQTFRRLPAPPPQKVLL